MCFFIFTQFYDLFAISQLAEYQKAEAEKTLPRNLFFIPFKELMTSSRLALYMLQLISEIRYYA